MVRSICIALAALAAGVAAAQEARRPDPADLKAKVPPVEYRSAFEGYRPFADQELRDWRKANAEVREAAQKPAVKAGKPHGVHK
jgi:hypothetical protein